jgi:transposase
MLNSRESEHRVFLACGPTDLRKCIDGLCAIVSQTFELDLFSCCLFVFCNKNRDKLKILRWEHNGFWLYYRRLERGRFRWPSGSGKEAMAISRRELDWLLDGLCLEQKQAHKEVSCKIAA